MAERLLGALGIPVRPRGEVPSDEQLVGLLLNRITKHSKELASAVRVLGHRLPDDYPVSGYVFPVKAIDLVTPADGTGTFLVYFWDYKAVCSKEAEPTKAAKTDFLTKAIERYPTFTHLGEEICKIAVLYTSEISAGNKVLLEYAVAIPITSPALLLALFKDCSFNPARKVQEIAGTLDEIMHQAKERRQLARKLRK